MTVLFMGPDRLQSVLDRVTQLTAHELLIGVPADEANRSGEAISNAAIGYINEYGSPELNIPARPHLIPGVRAALPRCTAEMERAAREGMASGAGGSGLAGLTRAGLVAVASVQRYLTKGDAFAPLSAATLARRKAKGRTGERPLIDSGKYRQSLTFVVRRVR